MKLCSTQLTTKNSEKISKGIGIESLTGPPEGRRISIRKTQDYSLKH